ncbi:polyamine aminopropyltransferase [Candidatus Azambacteria bacterium]|nr:polyamine aminopropyltransferase [Candidatus Azambacteria bacterium]
MKDSSREIEIEGKTFRVDWLNDGFACMHGVEEVVYSKQSPFQMIDIIKTRNFGKCLFLDGKMQSSESDEFIYHEALVHPAMLAHPSPKRVFIAGGGEGATLREILRHRSVQRALMIDIDPDVVEASKYHLPNLHQGAFEDPRAEIQCMDAKKYLQENDEQFDVIVIDLSEPIEEGPAYLLYTKEFYSLVQKRLTPQGVISMQAGTTAPGNLLCLGAVYQTLKTAFPIVMPYQVNIPSFGLPWGFIMALKSVPMKDQRYYQRPQMDLVISRRIKGTLAYYDEQAHKGMFSLPKFVREEIENEKRIIMDNHPLCI